MLRIINIILDDKNIYFKDNIPPFKQTPTSVKKDLTIILSISLLLGLQSCINAERVESTDYSNQTQKVVVGPVTIRDLGAFTCDETEKYHSRLCGSTLEVSLGERRDTLWHMKFGEPIEYSILDIKGEKYLFTDNTYFYHYGYTVERWELYSLSPEHFMEPLFYQAIDLYQEAPRENNGEYTHYANKTDVEVTTGDTIKFYIERYTLICPEAVSTCDTVLRTTEHTYFSVP